MLFQQRDVIRCGILDALARDGGRAADDISVLVLAITPNQGDGARRLSVELPIPPLLRP